METTAQQIAQNYSACLDSVNVINSNKPSDWSNAEWQIFINNNKEHLRLMLAKDFWTAEDLEPLRLAANA